MTGSPSPLSLVIVDDDDRILELTAHAARETGLFSPIVTSTNARHALAEIIVSNEPPGVILTDLSMPHMDGFEFAQTLKSLSSTKHIPIFMFSSSGLHYDEQHALDAGCTAFFLKPSTLSGLTELLKEVARLARPVEALCDFSRPSGE